jgi:phage/plasmid-associated DNA primase
MGNKESSKKVKAKKKERRTLSVLLLGAGESGKSTIFKQMKIIHHNGYTNEERLEFKPIIQSNIVRNMKALVTASLSLGIPIENPENRERAHGLNSIKSQELLNIESIWKKELAADIMELWKDPGVLKTYDERHNFQIDDSSQ